MSGGHFGYKQFRIGDIANDIEVVIRQNDSVEKDRYGDPIGYGFTPETIAEFRKGLKALRVAAIYAQRMDWLLSADDSEDSFHRRLREELAVLK